jgi:Stress up-regulated Nod 19
MMKRLGLVLGFALLLQGLVSARAPAPVGAETTGGVQVTTVRYGPFVLPPAGKGGDVDHANVVVPDVAKPCEDCFIVRAEPDLVYDDGSSANLDTGLMLHHAVFFNTGRPDTTCGKDTFFGRLGERFLASGNERTVKRLPDGYGYHLGRDPVTGVFHIMNHSAETKTVWFTYKVNWLPASTPGIRAVTPVWLDENNCRTSEYAVPAGPSSRHWTWTSAITGRIVATGGHVHTGGVRIVLTNQTTGERVCTSWAGYGTKPAYVGTIESMSYCSWDSLGVVKAGDTLDLESVYDAAEPVPDAMGIMVAAVYETNDLVPGRPAPPEANGAVAPPSAGTRPPAGASHHGHH